VTRVSRLKLPVGLVLTGLAGWVDAIGYLSLGGLFPSFMSGTTTQLGVALGTGDWAGVVLPAVVVALFVVGAFAGAVLSHDGARWRLVLCFALESLLLGTATLLSATSTTILALMPLPIAMGLQNVTARRLNRAGAGITFVTGTLVRLAETLAGANGDRAAWSGCALTWLSMTVGVSAGAAAYLALGPIALAGPALGCAVATYPARRIITDNGHCLS
jgi:uncharacterized membrane protein YoaK (UPF0700 family)